MSHLDMAAIGELKDIMEDGFSELVDAFIMDSEEKLEQLKAAISERDTALIGELGHSLKGASSNICAVPLADIYKDIEAAGREGSLDGVDEMLEKALAEFQNVKAALQAV